MPYVAEYLISRWQCAQRRLGLKPARDPLFRRPMRSTTVCEDEEETEEEDEEEETEVEEEDTPPEETEVEEEGGVWGRV